VQSLWEADWAKLWHLHTVLADSKAVARQVQTLILEDKMKKSGGGGGVGWGLKVVRHMPWGALSGFPGVMGHESIFWGLCGGFCVPVLQYIQYIHILTIYLHIHAY
jgi:hypothetical protein